MGYTNMETKTTLFKKAEEETNFCVPVDAIGLVVALEVARQRPGVPVIADEHDVLPCMDV